MVSCYDLYSAYADVITRRTKKMARARMPKPIKTKSGRTILPAPLMEGETMRDRKREVKRWGEAFGRSALEELNTAHAVESAHEKHATRHSDGEVPWQIALGDYQILFRENNPRGKSGEGSWGIYLRDYNVRLATFAPNSAYLRTALTMMFDAIRALSESAR